MKSPFYRGIRHGRGLLYALLLASPATVAQSQSAPATPWDQPEIASKIDRLTKSLEQTQVELAESRTEIQQLRAALQQVLTRMDAVAPGSADQTGPSGSDTATPQASSVPSQGEDTRGKAAEISQDD